MVVLVEGGIVGSLLFLCFLTSLLVASARWVRNRDDRVLIASALLTGLVLSVGSNGFDVVVTYFWLLLGLSFGLGLTRYDMVAAITQQAAVTRRTEVAAWHGRRGPEGLAATCPGSPSAERSVIV